MPNWPKCWQASKEKSSRYCSSFKPWLFKSKKQQNSKIRWSRKNFFFLFNNFLRNFFRGSRDQKLSFWKKRLLKVLHLRRFGFPKFFTFWSAGISTKFWCPEKGSNVKSPSTKYPFANMIKFWCSIMNIIYNLNSINFLKKTGFSRKMFTVTSDLTQTSDIGSNCSTKCATTFALNKSNIVNPSI